MTVAELITELQTADPEAIVTVEIDVRTGSGTWVGVTHYINAVLKDHGLCDLCHTRQAPSRRKKKGGADGRA